MWTLLRLVFCLFLVAGAAVVLVKIVTAEANGGSDRLDGQCDPFLRLSEFFDGVAPPALPSGWSSTPLEATVRLHTNKSTTVYYGIDGQIVEEWDA